MWPRLKNSPHTYAHEGLESIFLFEFIELQWVQTDFLRLSDNNNFFIIILFRLLSRIISFRDYYLHLLKLLLMQMYEKKLD